MVYFSSLSPFFSGKASLDRLPRIELVTNGTHCSQTEHSEIFCKTPESPSQPSLGSSRNDLMTLTTLNNSLNNGCEELPRRLARVRVITKKWHHIRSVATSFPGSLFSVSLRPTHSRPHSNPIALVSSLSRQGLGTRIESRAEALPAKRWEKGYGDEKTKGGREERPWERGWVDRFTKRKKCSCPFILYRIERCCRYISLSKTFGKIEQLSVVLVEISTTQSFLSLNGGF